METLSFMTLSRLMTLDLSGKMDLPLNVVRKQIVSAVDLIVQASRLRDGSRKVTHITEIAGMEGEVVVLQDISKFTEEGEKDGKVLGGFAPGGMRPNCEARLKNHGFNLPTSMYMTSSGRSGPKGRGRR